MSRVPSLLVAPCALFLLPPLVAQSAGQPAPTPPPLVQALPRASNPLLDPGAQQRIYGPSRDTLISRQDADGILEGFKKAYKTDGAPRIVIYVNRALIDTASAAWNAGSAAASERRGTASRPADGAYASPPPSPEPRGAPPTAAPVPTLADQQTVREIERLFGRAFRHAGAQLADQKIAASLLPDAPGAPLTGDPAAKDRKALADIADIAIEVLISSRNLTMPEVSGDVTINVPDIQATAIRLKDSAIVGQAAASEIIGRGAQAGNAVRRFSAQDITEATALALMEDMLTGKR